MHIFLDVDGVLNTESEWRVPYHLDINCISVLNSLISLCKDEVYVVLSSTWRAGFDIRNGHTPQIQKLINMINPNVKGFDKTPQSDKGRQAEIEYYIRRNGVNKYIVLDDDISLFDKPKSLNLYITNAKTGLTDKDIKVLQRSFLK